MATPQHPAQLPETFVRWLRQVAPYVHAFRGRTFVVAFGGELYTERQRFLSFVHDLNLLAALGIRQTFGLFVGPFSVQPSEPAKLALVLWGADLLATRARVGHIPISSRRSRHMR